MGSPSSSRLLSELKDVATQQIPVVFAQPEESDIHHWHALIREREAGPCAKHTARRPAARRTTPHTS